MQILRTLAVTAALAVFAPSVALCADPPTEAAIDAARDAFRQQYMAAYQSEESEREAKLGELPAVADAAIAAFDWSGASCDLIQRLTNTGLLRFATAAGARPVHERLEALAGGTDLESMRAAAMAAGHPDWFEGTEAQVAALRRVLHHPAIAEALAAGNADVFGVIGAGYDDAVLAAVAPDYAKLVASLDASASPPVLFGAQGVVTSLLRSESDAVKAPRETMRKHLVTVYAEAEQNAKSAGADERTTKRLERGRMFLDGAYAKGMLLNHPAPELDFLWYSGDDGASRLSDLRGKVVVVDFWATWCGPCIASFPNMRKVQDHFAGKDVVILGSTSVQGTHYGANGKVDCTGDPEKEFSLMPEFMKEKEMTWTVAFSSQDVFNPEYGVNGIPSVVIVDRKGIVRKIGMHPGADLDEFIAAIEEVLGQG